MVKESVGWSRAKQIKHARWYGRAYAKRTAEEFISKPALRGPHFTWAMFIDSIGNMAEVQVFTHFPFEIDEELETIAARTARRTAIKLIKKAKAEGRIE